MKKTKIDWCDCTVNPVVGCPNGCEYCYARIANKRFHWVKDWDKPEFFPDRLKQFEAKTPHSVFIDSMSDIGTWEDEWLLEVVKAIIANPQHNYIVLTKTNVFSLNKRLYDAATKATGRKSQSFPLFIGKSITNQAQADALQVGANTEYTDFLSIEPLLSPIDFRGTLFTTNFIIIGAETGKREDKVVPQKEWVADLVRQANEAMIPVFMKESLRQIMGEDFRQDIPLWELAK